MKKSTYSLFSGDYYVGTRKANNGKEAIDNFNKTNQKTFTFLGNPIQADKAKKTA